MNTYINSNLSPVEIASIHFPDLDIVQNWAEIAERLSSADLGSGDIKTGFPDEDCLEADILTPLSNLIDSISADGRIAKKDLLEALRLIEQSATDCQSRLAQSGEYAKGELESLENAICTLQEAAS